MLIKQRLPLRGFSELVLQRNLRKIRQENEPLGSLGLAYAEDILQDRDEIVDVLEAVVERRRGYSHRVGEADVTLGEREGKGRVLIICSYEGIKRMKSDALRMESQV